MNLSEFDKQELIGLLSSSSFKKAVFLALTRMEQGVDCKTIEESALAHHYLRGARDLINVIDVLIGKQQSETAIPPRRLGR